MITTEKVDLLDLIKNSNVGLEEIAELFADKPDIIIALLTNKRVLEDENIDVCGLWGLVWANSEVAGFVAGNDELLNFLLNNFNQEAAGEVDTTRRDFLELDEEIQREQEGYIRLCDAIEQKHPELFETKNSDNNNNNEPGRSDQRKAKIERSQEENEQIKKEMKAWGELKKLKRNEISARAIVNLVDTIKILPRTSKDYKELLLSKKSLRRAFLKIQNFPNIINIEDLVSVVKHRDNDAFQLIRTCVNNGVEINQCELFRQLAIHCSDNVAKYLVTTHMFEFHFGSGDILYQILKSHPMLLPEILKSERYKKLLISYQQLLAIGGHESSKLSDASNSNTLVSGKPGPGYETYLLGEAFHSNNDMKNAVMTWLVAMSEESFEAYLALGRLLGADEKYESLIHKCAMEYLDPDTSPPFCSHVFKFVVDQIKASQKVEDKMIGDRVFQATAIYVLENSDYTDQKAHCARYLVDAAKVLGEVYHEIQFLFELEEIDSDLIEKDEWKKMGHYLMDEEGSSDDYFERLERAAIYFHNADDQDYFSMLRRDHLERTKVKEGEEIEKEKQEYIDRIIDLSPMASRLTAHEFFELQKHSTSHKASVKAYEKFIGILQDMDISDTNDLNQFDSDIKKHGLAGYFEQIEKYCHLLREIVSLSEINGASNLLDKLFIAVKEHASLADDEEKKILADNIDELINELVNVFRVENKSFPGLIYRWYDVKYLGMSKHLYHESLLEDSIEKQMEAVFAGSVEACLTTQSRG